MIANHEENRELDVRRLRDSGVRVHVTRIETVPEAVDTFEELFDDVLGWPRPDWLAEARQLWCGPLPEVTRTVAIPIWRDPWMVVGGSHVHRRPGPPAGLGQRVRGEQRPLPEGRPRGRSRRQGVDLVLLPDEPYVFTDAGRARGVPPRPRPGWSAAGC